MKKTGKSRSEEVRRAESDPIADYGQCQPGDFRTICERLRELIDAALPKARSQIWHGSPVWFIGDNPVVGYSTSAKAVNLLFWNGQALDEAGLKPIGKYRAAQAGFSDITQIKAAVIRRWLRKARTNVFDSKAFFRELRAKNKGGGS